MSTIEATSIDTVFVEKDVSISKRSKAGKFAHELLALDEYDAVVGHVTNGWEGEQRILFTAKNFDDAVDAMVTYIAEAKPVVRDYRNNPERFFVLKRGLWNVFEQEFTFVEGVGLFYNKEDDKVERIEFPFGPAHRIEWEFRKDIDSSSLSPVKTALSRLSSHREAVQKKNRRESLIETAKATFEPNAVFEQMKRNAENIVSTDINMELRSDWRTPTDVAVDFEVKALCAKFLEVLGKTDWEVQYPRPIDSHRWTQRDAQNSVPSVIDEVHAYAITVAQYTRRNRSTGDATITLIGLVLREFNEVMNRW